MHTRTHTHCNNPFTTLECNGLECCPISAPICRPFPLTPKDRWLPRTQCPCPSLLHASCLMVAKLTIDHSQGRQHTWWREGRVTCMHADTQTDRHMQAYIHHSIHHTTHTHTCTHNTHTHTHTATIPWLECVLHTLRRMEGGSMHNPVGKVGVSIVTV